MTRVTTARTTALLVVIGCCAAAGGCRRRASVPPQPPPDKKQPIRIHYPMAPGSFVKLAARLKPSVVHLSTTAAVRGGPSDWFPAETLAGPALGGQMERMRRSLGTGVILSAEGHVLTNHHVISKADEVRVQLHDGTSGGRAKVIGKDPGSDLALLSFVPPADVKLKPARLGDSDLLKPGEWVLALGDPFGLGQTVSVGVISARERQDLTPGRSSYWGFLQTDVKINPGNSGGPLVNVVGEVVGIATAVEPETHGIGFAVPINLAKKILPMLRREGKVVQAYLGIYSRAVDEQTAEELKLKKPHGALITSVVQNGPAALAGLRAGDVIIAYDHKKIRHASELPWLASMAGINRMVPVKVWRNGKVYAFSIKSVPKPD